MADHARSSDPAVQAQLDRLAALSPGRDILGLERITELCARLGNPQLRLPRTFHVAGTNGKGSTCAYLRAILEAQGRRVHAYTSPHLVRFNERIRLAGTLIDDALLAALLEEVLDEADDLQASFFEVTTAAAFLAFARIPADDCIIEVGLGGRLDATNVIPSPAVAGIASLGIDHEAFLLAPEAGTPIDPAMRIAWEKAGIIKPDTPVATLAYPPHVRDIVAAKVADVGATLFPEGEGWTLEADGDAFRWISKLGSVAPLLRPRMVGAHQMRNAGLAIAMLRLAPDPRPTDTEIAAGVAGAFWPGRMQRLDAGPLTALLPPAIQSGSTAGIIRTPASHSQKHSMAARPSTSYADCSRIRTPWASSGPSPTISPRFRRSRSPGTTITIPRIFAARSSPILASSTRGPATTPPRRCATSPAIARPAMF